MESMIGAKFILLKSMLGNKAGVVGYVFNQYNDFNNPDGIAVQVIFPNGNYDGFSVEEQKLYLKYMGYNLNYVEYQFQNIIQVSKDFKNGYWKFE